MAIYKEKPSDFHPKIEVIGCFLEYENKILLLHRQDYSFQGNFWGIPVGKLEQFETPLDAAIREISEETGLLSSRKRSMIWGRYILNTLRLITSITW